MDLDECSSLVELDQVAIAARLQLGARRAGRRRRRVQRVLDADVVIGVDLDVFPERHVVGNAVVRQQVSAFFIFEDHQWQLVRGAVVALAGDLEAPRSRLAACVGEVDEGAALPEAPARVLDKSLDLGFVPRPPHTGRVQQQPARLAVLHKRPRRTRVERISARHRGREIIQDQPLGAALKECPRLLQPFDGGLHRLVDQRPQEAVAAIRQGDAQTPDPLLAARFRIRAAGPDVRNPSRPPRPVAWAPCAPYPRVGRAV